MLSTISFCENRGIVDCRIVPLNLYATRYSALHGNWALRPPKCKDFTVIDPARFSPSGASRTGGSQYCVNFLRRFVDRVVNNICLTLSKS